MVRSTPRNKDWKSRIGSQSFQSGIDAHEGEANGVLTFSLFKPGEDCPLNLLIGRKYRDRVLARDANRESAYRTASTPSLTALCAIVIHRDSGTNET